MRGVPTVLQMSIGVDELPGGGGGGGQVTNMKIGGI